MENRYVKEIKKFNKPVQYQKIVIEYKYNDKLSEPLRVKTPKSLSYGVCENRDMKTKELTGYSIPFVCENDIFIAIIEAIEKFCRDKVTENESMLKKGGMKSLNIQNLNILKYKDDDPNAHPILYAKIPIDFKSKKMDQVFRKKNEGDILGESLINKRCDVVGCLAIEGVYIGSMIQSIQVKLLDGVVYKKEYKIERSRFYIKDDDLESEDEE
ncbi:TPA_asm: SSDBP [Hydra adintovirus]|nr:TPA_asm: SSDBP [Hydra adintovirus]